MRKFWGLIVLFMLFPVMLLAADVVIPDAPGAEQIIDAIVALISNWKVLGTWGIASSVLVIIVMILKSGFTDFLFKWNEQAPLVKRVIIVVLGQVIGIITTIATGTVWYSAVITGLFASGGAITIYEALKPLFAKSE